MSPHCQPTDVRDMRILSAFSLKVHLQIQIKATLRFCHWNSASTPAQRLSDLVETTFFPDNYSPVLGFCPVPCHGGLAACIQLLLCEWQLIKALGFCWRHCHYVIPLQGSAFSYEAHCHKSTKDTGTNPRRIALKLQRHFIWHFIDRDNCHYSHRVLFIVLHQ